MGHEQFLPDQCLQHGNGRRTGRRSTEWSGAGFLLRRQPQPAGAHWAVESESAKELTTSTFAHYTANPQATKAESLRQAMLKVMGMAQFSHPA